MSTFVNINSYFDNMLYAMGSDVQPGTAPCANFGIQAFAPASGGEPIYGWRQDYRLLTGNSNQNVRATMANHLARRIAYIGPGSEIRFAGQEKGGRPYPSWLPEILPDNSTGINGDTWQLFPPIPGFPLNYPPGGVVRTSSGDQTPYCGFDMQHNWEILYDIIKNPTLSAIQIPTGFGAYGPATWPAGILAGWRLWAHAEMTAGEMRLPFNLNWQANLNLGQTADRGWSTGLRVNLRAALVGCTNTIALGGAGGTDIDSASLAFLDAAIEFFRHQPGVAVTDKGMGASQGGGYPGDVPPLVDPARNYILIAHHAWAVVVFYEWLVALTKLEPASDTDPNGLTTQHGKRVGKMKVILPRMCTWVKECSLGCTVGIGAGRQPWRVSFTAGALGPTSGLGPPPLPEPGTSVVASLLGVPVTMHYDDQNRHTDTWAFRALRIGDKLGVAGCAAKWAAILTAPSFDLVTQNKNDPQQWTWLVGADGGYDASLIKPSDGSTPFGIVGEPASVL